MLYIGAKVFALSFVAPAKLFQRFGLFLWNNLPVASTGLFLKNKLVEPTMPVFEGRHNKERSQSQQSSKAIVVF